ncbi:MAG: ROK family protein [Candidatus Nomurabacteria bacterium]|jgi:predicted NBD/HSP70 family sugar kinase|nr:ROK family protein [Candidatus Nomurabacteria bacterium]
MKQILTVDIGGTKTRLVWFDGQISNISDTFVAPVLNETEFPTPPDPDELVNTIFNKIYENSSDEAELTVISIASRGMISDDSENITDNLLNMSDFPMVAKIQAKLPYTKVFLGNDAKCGTLGAFPADFKGRGLYLAIGTGIGGGMMINGDLSHELRDMEIGKIKILRDGLLQKWEDFASGTGFAKKNGCHGEQVPAGDSAWRQYADDLVVGIMIATPILYPDKIVIGGGFSDNFAKFAPALFEILQDTDFSPEIVAVQDHHHVVNRGALTFALKNWNSRP